MHTYFLKTKANTIVLIERTPTGITIAIAITEDVLKAVEFLISSALVPLLVEVLVVELVEF